MVLKRVIPCLDVDAGRVVKGTNFVDIRDAGDPVELAERYDAEGADELVFLDITASHERRDTIVGARPPDGGQRLHPVHDRRRHPLGRRRTGGARRGRRQDLGQLLGARPAGADRRAGRASSARNAWSSRSTRSGRATATTSTSPAGATRVDGREAVAWAREAAERGAGEILLTSMDRDGTADGYELELTRAVADAVGIPVIASGGAGDAGAPLRRHPRRPRRRRPRRLDLPLRQAHGRARRRSTCTRRESRCGASSCSWRVAASRPASSCAACRRAASRFWAGRP